MVGNPPRGIGKAEWAHVRTRPHYRHTAISDGGDVLLAFVCMCFMLGEREIWTGDTLFVPKSWINTSETNGLSLLNIYPSEAQHYRGVNQKKTTRCAYANFENSIALVFCLRQLKISNSSIIVICKFCFLEF